MKPWDDNIYEVLGDDEDKHHALWLETKADEYLFCLQDVPNIGVIASITPKLFFEEHKFMYDQHIDIEHILPKEFYCEIEGVYAIDNEIDEANKLLVDAGFIESQELKDFLESN